MSVWFSIIANIFIINYIYRWDRWDKILTSHFIILTHSKNEKYPFKNFLKVCLKVFLSEQSFKGKFEISDKKYRFVTSLKKLSLTNDSITKSDSTHLYNFKILVSIFFRPGKNKPGSQYFCVKLCCLGLVR